MLEILQNFESAVSGPTRLSGLVLIVPGLVAIIVGLFVWLGGLGFRKLLGGLVGAIIGAICGFFLISRHVITTAISSGVAALASIIFERLLIAVLLAALAAVLSFAVLVQPYIETADAVAVNQSQIKSHDSTRSIQESIETIKAYAVSFSKTVRNVCSQVPLYRWAIIAALTAIFFAAGFWLWRLASALCFSVLGTSLIFVGMILLLLYKGSKPITKIDNRSSFYAIVVIAMIIFGTFEQLLLCKLTKERSIRKKQANKDKQEPE